MMLNLSLLLGVVPSGAGGGLVGAFDALTTDMLGLWSAARRLLTSHATAIIRVRRSSDSTEQDIGVVAATGLLDTASLLTFCGAGNGFITKVYDQSGNSRDMVNTTAGNQPQIVSSGAVLTAANGQPKMTYGLTDALLISGYSRTSADFTWLGSGAARGTTRSCLVANSAYARAAYPRGYDAGKPSLFLSGVVNSTEPSSTAHHVFTYSRASTTWKFYRSGTEVVSTTDASSAALTSPIWGNIADADGEHMDYTQELALYGVALDSTTRLAVEAALAL